MTSRWFVLPLAALVGCSRAPAPTSDADATTATVEETIVRVDPSLVETHRIAIGVVEHRAPRGDRVYPSVVTASDHARAEAGVLVAGRVTSLVVEPGSAVHRGQVLGWVDAPEIARAVADLLRARARHEVAESKLRRQLVLATGNATSENAVEEARADALVAAAELSAARSLLANLGAPEPPEPVTAAVLPARAPIRSPIDGVVSRRFAVLGGAVVPDQPLFEVVTPGDVVVAMKIPETETLPAMGQVVTVRARTGGAASTSSTCPAVIAGELAVIDEALRARTVRVEPSAPCAFLVAGAYVDVVVSVQAQSAPRLVVPRSAVVEVNGAPVVFVVRSAGTFAARPVRLGESLGADVVIEDGLSEGDPVAVSGTLLLKGELLRAEMRP